MSKNKDDEIIDEAKPRVLTPLTKWEDKHGYPPPGQLRALVFNAEKNGFSKCIRRIGKRVLIDDEKYFQWVDEQNN